MVNRYRITFGKVGWSLKNPALPSLLGRTLNENIKGYVMGGGGGGGGWGGPLTSPSVIIFSLGNFLSWGLGGGGRIFIVCKVKVDMNSLRSHLL